MSDPYFIPEAPGAPAVSQLPTERLHEIVATYKRHAEALIEIAAGFDYWEDEGRVFCICDSCGESMTDGCHDTCPGLLARRALGVAP